MLYFNTNVGATLITRARPTFSTGYSPPTDCTLPTPQQAVGGRTDLVLLNTNPKMAEATVEVFGQDGGPRTEETVQPAGVERGGVDAARRRGD